MPRRVDDFDQVLIVDQRQLDRRRFLLASRLTAATGPHEANDQDTYESAMSVQA